MVFTHRRGRIKGRSLPSSKTVEQIVHTVFRAERRPLRGDFNVIFVDSATIKKLNRQYLGHRGTTDVIAFSYDADAMNFDVIFGEVYISIPEARLNARRHSVAFAEEVLRLVIHGTLHLLGYDDHAPRDRKRMWSRQEKLVQRIRAWI